MRTLDRRLLHSIQSDYKGSLGACSSQGFLPRRRLRGWRVLCSAAAGVHDNRELDRRVEDEV